MNKPLFKYRPVTYKMKLVLKQCLERDENKLPPFGVYYSQSTKGLAERGFGIFKECCFNGKTYVGFFLTEAGAEFARLVH